MMWGTNTQPNKIPCLSATNLHGHHPPTRVQHHLSCTRPLQLQRLSITLVDRSKVSGKGFDEENIVFLVLLKFEVLNIEEQRVTTQKKRWYRSRKPGEAAGT